MSDRVEVLAGPGTVIRFGKVVIWAGPSASPALLTFLLQSARNVGASTRGGRQLVDHVAGILATRDPEPGAPFAAVGPADGAWVTVLHGPVQLWDGSRWLAPSPTPGWLQSTVVAQPAFGVGPAGTPAPRLTMDSPYDLTAGMVPGGGIVLYPETRGGPLPYAPPAAAHVPAASPAGPGEAGPVGSAPVGPFTPSPGAHEPYPAGTAEAGATLAGGLGAASVSEAASRAGDEEDRTRVEAFGPEAGGEAPTVVSEPVRPAVDPTTVAPAGAPGPDPTALMATPPEPAGEPGGRIDLRGGPAGSRPALAPVSGASGDGDAGGAGPVVDGVRCERGHLNHPAALTCARCRLRLEGRPRSSGPRPPLGVLIGDDGFVYKLEGDLIAGSDPSADPAVSGGRARGLTLTGPNGSVAAAHAEIRVTDWTAAVIDRGSAAGTYVVGPGQSTWRRLPPFEPTPLPPGSHLSLGQRVLTFVSPWAEKG